MTVHPKDGRCRVCGDTLTITDADDSTMTVECQNPDCQETYLVETDAFNDGALHYYPHFLAERMEQQRRARKEEPDDPD